QKLNFTAQKTAEIVASRITLSRYELVIIQASECSQHSCGFNMKALKAIGITARRQMSESQ
ncbi:MAG: hypothetical protein RR680_11215, partial [Hafnia sp.]